MATKALLVLFPLSLVLGACGINNQVTTKQDVGIEASALGFSLIMPKDPVVLRVIVPNSPQSGSPRGPVAKPDAPMSEPTPGPTVPSMPSAPVADPSILTIGVKREIIASRKIFTRGKAANLGKTTIYTGQIDLTLVLPKGISTENGNNKLTIPAGLQNNTISVKLKADNTVKVGEYEGSVIANGDSRSLLDRGNFKITIQAAPPMDGPSKDGPEAEPGMP